MNESSDERKHAGLNVLWPIIDNEHYEEALAIAEDGGSPNNISPIIKYGIQDSATVVWMGDLETDFLEKIRDEVDWPETAILFAPHHGRHTGKIPEDVLEKMNPKIIIIGEAPSKYLNYYQNYNSITQNSAGDITFECEKGKVHISVSEPDYEVVFLDDEDIDTDDYYIGTLNL